jgi:hypothetical protein
LDAGLYQALEEAMTHPGKKELQITDDERASLAMYDFEPVTSGPTPTPSSKVGASE